MNVLILDIETDGLNPNVIHCIAAKWYKLDGVSVFSDTYQYAELPLIQIAHFIENADRVVAHNGCGFDFPVLERLLGIKIPQEKLFDTFPVSQMLCPMIAEKDMRISMPSNERGKYSLRAWGYRLKAYKGDFYGPWDTVTDEMVDYCKKDVETLEALYDWALKKNYPIEAIKTEMELAPIIHEMTEHGFKLDVPAAEEFYIDLVEKRFQAKQELIKTFPPRFVDGGLFTPKVNNKGYTKGASLCRIEYQEFNPNSKPQIIDRLIKLYGWKPRKFTENGNPSIDEDVLADLPYTEAKVLNEYNTIQKRIGQLIEGKQGWLKCVDDKGRIHGKYMQCGTLTGRASHWGPNLGQVPAPGKLYGEECRKLFTCEENKVLVGVDMSGLEPRCFAGYMKPYDGGSAIHSVLFGSAEEGTDLYTEAANTIGQPRKVGKTLVLAMLYGAGNKKLAWTVDPLLDPDAAAAYGKQIRSNISSSIEGFKQLSEDVVKKVKQNGYVQGLDKRKLYPRSEHAALNALLQSAGAVLSKRWTIIAYNDLKDAAIRCDFIAYIHDELVIECDPEDAELVKNIVVKATTKAGEYFKFPCPLTGEGKIGKTWFDIH